MTNENTDKHFLVKWIIDEFAPTPQEAIRMILEDMPHPANKDAVCTHFEVDEINDSGQVVATHQIDIAKHQG